MYAVTAPTPAPPAPRDPWTGPDRVVESAVASAILGNGNSAFNVVDVPDLGVHSADGDQGGGLGAVDEVKLLLGGTGTAPGGAMARDHLAKASSSAIQFYDLTNLTGICNYC